MTDLLARAELAKLSRVLGAPGPALQFLAGRDARELRELGDRISAALFDEHRVAFQRLADASRLLPASLVARLAELVFGPVLCARVAGLMPPQRAVEVAAKLRPAFLADVTVQLDPRRATDLLALIPARQVVEVSGLLLARGDFLTMGRFVDGLPDAAVRAVVARVDDDAALVRIAAYVERRERLVELTGMIPEARLGGIVAAVASGSEDLQAAGLAMISRLSPEQQGRIGDIAIGLGAGPLKAFTAAAARLGANDVLRAVLGNVGAASRVALLKLLPGFVLP